MNVSKILASIFLLVAAVIVESRVRPPYRRIQHPQVLTRPPLPATTAAPVNAPVKAPVKAPLKAKAKAKRTNTTTPEPPEAPEAPDAPTAPASNYASPFYYDFDPFYGINPVSSLVYGGDLFGGGMSMEADDEIVTTTRRPMGRRFRSRQNRRPVARRYVAVTARPPPPKPTTPEPDDDFVGSAHASGVGSNIASSGGYCFCSPLKTCPRGSMQRGGYCWNFVSYFTDILYRRCCYSPSMAKYLNI